MKSAACTICERLVRVSRKTNRKTRVRTRPAYLDTKTARVILRERDAVSVNVLRKSMLTTSIEVLWTARYDYKKNWRLVPHAHDYFQMIYFLSGAGSLFLGHREYRVRPGDLFLIKPHTKHGLAPYSLLKTLDLKFRVLDAGF